jgi:hypothetical protein
LAGLIAGPQAGYAAGAQTIESRVVDLHDGDTITLLDAEHERAQMSYSLTGNPANRCAGLSLLSM